MKNNHISELIDVNSWTYAKARKWLHPTQWLFVLLYHTYWCRLTLLL